jgi:WD repeat-containing protein 24
VFGLVTSSGSLIVYNMHLPSRAMVKMTAHSGDATTLDWHPTRRYLVATGGAGDRSVKVWDLEVQLSMEKDESYMERNSNTVTSRAESTGTNDSSTGNEDGYAGFHE